MRLGRADGNRETMPWIYTLPVAAKHDGWETCVKASVTGATGKPFGERTYLVNIDNNQIGDRRNGPDRCAQETYPL